MKETKRQQLMRNIRDDFLNKSIKLDTACLSMTSISAIQHNMDKARIFRELAEKMDDLPPF